MSTLASNSVVGPIIQSFTVVNCVFQKLVIAHVGYVHLLYPVQLVVCPHLHHLEIIQIPTEFKYLMNFAMASHSVSHKYNLLMKSIFIW